MIIPSTASFSARLLRPRKTPNSIHCSWLSFVVDRVQPQKASRMTPDSIRNVVRWPHPPVPVIETSASVLLPQKLTLCNVYTLW